ncbi:MAG: AEC family transporter [Ignavibacteriales bacterium]|nr:AEC family transporter [Ignavibacteriales bacterium]MCF8316704.1 AEC family transporter [Ignavibacteriales bacterium]MCF8438338.1 AEC family transporter [Ignavibacteriales bacterium]
MQNLLFILNLTLPVFSIIFLGIFLRKIKLIDEHFNAVASRLVFNVSLPAFLFMKVIIIDFSEFFDLAFMAFAVIGSVLSFAGTWLFVHFSDMPSKSKGTFVQGAFRGNFAIVGLAVIASVLDKNALTKGAFLLTFILPIYNILSVIVLLAYNKESSGRSVTGFLKELAANPLILAVLAAVILNITNVPVPKVITKSGEYLAALTLPLALIGIGGSLDFTAARRASSMAFNSTVIKIIVIPAVFTGAGYLAGFRGSDLSLLLIFFGCPTAIASYVMAEALGGDIKLAGNVIVLTTIGAAATISLGLFILTFLN